MENHQPFEVDAALAAGDRAGLAEDQRRLGISGIRSASSSEAFDKRGTALAGAQEDEPLLSPSREESPGRRSPKWQGELDYAGLTWWQTPSVYWLILPFSLYTLSLGGIIVPKLDLILTLVCREFLSEQAAADPRFTFLPVDLFGDNSQCNSPEHGAQISSLASRFTLVLSLVAGVLAAFVSPKLGALSDKYGRKRVLAITTCGGVLSEVVTVVIAAHPDALNYRWLILGSFFEGISGSFISGMAITHSYASDCTPPAKRAVAFGYFHACLFSGIALGPLIAGLIIKATGNIIIIFYLALGGHLLFLLCLVFLIPESLTKKRQLAARDRDAKELAERSLTIIPQEGLGVIGSITSQMVSRVIDVVRPLQILWPTGKGSSHQLRMNLVFLSTVDTIIFGMGMGAATVVIYYSKLIFHWGPYESNIFVAIMNSCRVSALIIVLPLLNYIFRTRHRNKVQRESGVILEEKQSGSDQLDLYTVRLSIVLEMLGCIGYATARTGALFTASGIIASYGGMGSPTLQSALTKHVPHDRVGQLLGATGLLHAFARVLSPTIFNLLYAATTNTFPQAIFIVLIGCLALAFVASCLIKPHIYFDAYDDEATANPQTHND